MERSRYCWRVAGTFGRLEIWWDSWMRIWQSLKILPLKAIKGQLSSKKLWLILSFCSHLQWSITRNIRKSQTGKKMIKILIIALIRQIKHKSHKDIFLIKTRIAKDFRKIICHYWSLDPKKGKPLFQVIESTKF